MFQPAALALEDGTIFRGLSIGASGTTVGEVVFNTAMTGYQEILTDPSYCRQIVTLTYPHIGNTGVTREDEESAGIQAAGLIIRDLPLLASNFRSEQSLSDYLADGDTVAIADIDTRKLTRILRDGAISVEVEKERLSRTFADERHPRTAIGYSQNGQVLYLVAIDGRQPGYSVGMSLQDLAELLRARLADFSLAKENVYQGLNLDGGGSTTMVIGEQVVNSPSDPTGERPVANALLVVGSGPGEGRP